MGIIASQNPFECNPAVPARFIGEFASLAALEAAHPTAAAGSYAVVNQSGDDLIYYYSVTDSAWFTQAGSPGGTTPAINAVLTVGETVTSKDLIFELSATKFLKINRELQKIEIWDTEIDDEVPRSYWSGDSFSGVSGASNNYLYFDFIEKSITFSNSGVQTIIKSDGIYVNGIKYDYPDGPTSRIATLNDIPSASGITHVTASGTDTYTATISGVTSYDDGDAYLIKFPNGNTRECTLNINSLGAIRLQRNNGALLIGGDILDGGEMLCVYDSSITGFRVIGTGPNTLLSYVTNADSETITKGMVVFMSGGTGDRMTVKRANNTSESSAIQTVGFVLSQSILPGKEGWIMTQGLLDGLSILPTTTFADGDALYLGAQPGSITNIKPSAPSQLVYLGVVTTVSDISEGRLYVKIHNGETYKFIANQVYTGTPVWTGTTAPSGTLTASYSWNQIGNLVTVRINLSYVNGGSALTAVTIPLPTDCPSPYVASGGSPSSNRVICVGGGIMQTNFAPSTATTYVLLKTNSTNTGFDIIAQRASANYQVVTVTVTYLTT